MEGSPRPERAVVVGPEWILSTINGVWIRLGQPPTLEVSRLGTPIRQQLTAAGDDAPRPGVVYLLRGRIEHQFEAADGAPTFYGRAANHESESFRQYGANQRERVRDDSIVCRLEEFVRLRLVTPIELCFDIEALHAEPSGTANDLPPKSAPPSLSS